MIPDWAAAILGYGIMLVIAETDAAPLAVAGSWAIALMMLFDTARSGTTVSGLFNQLSGAAKAPSGAPPSVPAGATTSNPNNPTGYAPSGQSVGPYFGGSQ